ncbi:MAG: hypothetical protein CBB97_01045 [Candidatus Endolissoclinum sp. TMED37]|nr:MAG: hypothetical protein CBB97_01045 [Candidatus Endolissoclinum sp. TMED37]|tara:strand:- start:334 stop:621 length:288 start_codon:yes stop_codon:yes gene_type:complete
MKWYWKLLLFFLFFWLIIPFYVAWNLIKFVVWILTPSYKDKIKKIKGIGDKLADDIISHYPEEDDLKKASASQISKSINGVGSGLADKIKQKFYS